MFGSNFRDFVSQDTTSHDQSNPERLIKNWHGFEKPDSEDSSIEEEFEILESKNQGGAKGHHHSGDSGIEGEKESEISGDRSQPENKLQYSSFEDDYEIIEVSDLDKIQIAGFSKQELLEMCNFCKISYGNNDEKLDSRYKTKAALINEGYGITPFCYKKNGTLAGFVFTKDKEITIAYRGTKDLDDVMTDVSAAFTQEFSPEGGKMHSGFYNAFKDSWRSLEKILNDYAKEQGSEIKSFRINCTGHSMGAALATITALYLKEVKSAEHVRVVTFGSPRVFDSRGAEIYERLLGENTIRVTNLSDPIPMFPPGSMGFKHVGEPLKIKTGNFIVNCLVTDLHIVGKYYHKTDTYYGCIQDMKPEDFQPDNNVSRYYYLSYVVAVPYYIATTALTTPCYLFLSAISNTEQHYFERETKFADNQVSLKDNRNGLVIYTYSNAIADPLIMSHIECNINGRGEVPLYINNNRNSMELRQLCGTENMSVRFLSSIGADPVAGGSLAMRSTCSNSELSQQPQENVDRRENIINNEKASIEEAIGNDYRRSKMGKDIKTIEEKLSNAIDSIDYVSVIPLLKKLGDSAYGPTLQKLLSQANDKMTSLGEGRQKEDLAQIIALLKNELKHTAAVSPVDGTTASSHGAPVIEPESEGDQSDSLSSEDDQSDKPGESTGLKAQPSNTQEQQEVPETPILGQMDDTESLSTQDGLVFQSDSTTVLSINGDEKERVPIQPVESESKGDQQDSPPLSPQNSVSGDECSSVPSSFTKLPKSDEGDTDNNNDKYVKVSSEDITKEDLTPKGSGSLQGIQSEISVPSPSAFPNGNGAPTIEEHMVIMADIEDSSGRLVGEGDVSSITGDLHGISIEDDMSSLGTANDEYGEDSSGEDVTDESEKTNKGDSTLKSSNSTKSSKLPIVAASALAVTGVATGIAIAVYLEMLAVGVAVGVCCLVAAVIIYYCNRPSNSLECNNVGPVADRKLVG